MAAASKILKDTWKKHSSNKDFRAHVRRGVLGGTLGLKAQAIALTPVDTGRLRASHWHRVRTEALAGSITGTVGTNVFYAVYVEFRKSFYRLALDVMKIRILRHIERSMTKWLEEGQE